MSWNNINTELPPIDMNVLVFVPEVNKIRVGKIDLYNKWTIHSNDVSNFFDEDTYTVSHWQRWDFKGWNLCREKMPRKNREVLILDKNTIIPLVGYMYIEKDPLVLHGIFEKVDITYWVKDLSNTMNTSSGFNYKDNPHWQGLPRKPRVNYPKPIKYKPIDNRFEILDL